MSNGQSFWWDKGTGLCKDSDDGYTTLCVYLIPMNCTLTNGEKVKHYAMSILLQFKNLNNKRATVSNE